MEQKLIPKIFIWMTLGLLMTFLTGYGVSLSENMLISIFENNFYLFFIIAEIVLVILLSARLMKMKPTTAKICFLLYSFTSGLTFSSIFVAYELTSIIYIFLITAIVFAIFAAIGYFSKIDLTKMSSFLLMGLFAIIICSIINIFVANSSFESIVSIIAILIFIGFTAYDMQKLVRLQDANLPEENLAIYGALELYLDYINIFLNLLSIFGSSKD